MVKAFADPRNSMLWPEDLLLGLVVPLVSKEKLDHEKCMDALMGGHEFPLGIPFRHIVLRPAGALNFTEEGVYFLNYLLRENQNTELKFLILQGFFFDKSDLPRIISCFDSKYFASVAFEECRFWADDEIPASFIRTSLIGKSVFVCGGSGSSSYLLQYLVHHIKHLDTVTLD